VHAGGRRKGKGRSRILYWFRTPPGVKVGRAALDEDAIRLIEESNPDIDFDWTRILKGHDLETAPAPVRERDARHERRRGEPRPGGPPPDHAPAVDALAREGLPEDVPTADEVPVPIDDLDADDGIALLPADPAVAETPEDVRAATPAHARIGSEGVSRLRGRYAELLARISDRIPDPARQEELKTQAERLNPDTWVTDAEVTAGLENYEAVFETLRSAVGGQPRRRRRKRRRGGGPRGQTPSGGGDQSDGADETQSDAEEPGADR
jgi:hypothetical protein